MATPKKRVTSGASNSGANQGSPGVSHITAAMGSTTLQEDPNSLKVVGKRVDLPIEAYAKDVEKSPFTARPAGNEPGNEYRGSASINAFEVTATPKMDVYMYSVSVKDKTNPPRGLIKELWNSNTVQRAINPDPKKNPINWIFNGYNLAWCVIPKMKSDQEIKVTLDPGSKKETVFTLVIKYTRLIPMSPLRDYLNGGKNACTSDVVMCLNFLDHVLRQTPSTTHQLIGKNFFGQTPGPPKDIDGYLEVIKGSFASIRVGRDRNKEKGRGLIVNVDVANTVFWQPLILYDTVYTMVKKHFNLPEARVPEYLLPSRGSEGMIEPEAFQFLRRLRGVKFQVIIPKKSNEAQSRKTHIIERFHFDETKDGGANAMNVTFVKKDKDGKKTGEVTVLQHFKDFHGYEINRKMCPLVETKRHDYFPLEVCQILPLQRYRYKLVFEQTNTMIGYSASPPRDRIRDINDAVRNLRWATDSNLGAFGLRINDIMLNPKQPRAPAKLYFFRDGVSEGQFQHVIDTEVQAIKKVFTDNEYAKPKITVIAATKRHHIRAFLDSKNPGPGILVEDVATHPQHWDFYLYSHRAILGTSRPVHYHVIMDEIGHTKASLTNLIYQQCYQYSRCHTPVSLHPAIYYAHRISLRARSHVADKKEPGDDRIKVMPIGDLRNSMWFA